MSKEIAGNIIKRLSADERRVLELRTVQLPILDGDKGLLIEKHMKVPASTMRSLQARGLTKGKLDPKTRIIRLTGLGVAVNEMLVSEEV